ncbi:MAG: hypothetical protein KAH84_11970 [Thiomargarita sp.]|nr:hypothetical protein [Thiomargarita sp.]
MTNFKKIIQLISLICCFLLPYQVQSAGWVTGTDVPIISLPLTQMSNSSYFPENTDDIIYNENMKRWTLIYSIASPANPFNWQGMLDHGNKVYIRLFIPPGVITTGIGFNSNFLAGSRVIYTQDFGERDCTNAPVFEPNGNTENGWNSKIGDSNVIHERDPNFFDKPSCLIIGFYNVANADNFLLTTFAFDYFITDKELYESWAKGNQAPIAKFTINNTEDESITGFTNDIITVKDAGSNDPDEDGSLAQVLDRNGNLIGVGNYHWGVTKKDDTAVADGWGEITNNNTGASANITFLKAGEYKIVLRVTDNEGASSQLTKDVAVIHGYAVNTTANEGGYVLMSFLSNDDVVTNGDAICMNNPNCSKKFPAGITVIPLAITKQGYSFEGWSGDCEDETEPFAVLTMDSNKTCTPNFSLID